MDNFKLKLKQAWDENPLAVIGVGALAVTAASKLLTAFSQTRRDRIYDREIARRERNDRRNR